MKPLICLLCIANLSAEPMFRGNPAHTGVYDSADPALSTVKWKYKTNARIVSSPAVAQGAIYFGSADHSLYAVNMADGALRWKFATRGAVNSSPAVVDGVVYAGSLDGNLYAVDAGTGQVKWKFQTQGERRFTAPGIHGIMPKNEMMPDPYDLFLSSPTILGNAIYFGSGDHNVYALDRETGALRWKFSTGDVVHTSPAVADGVLYIGSWDRNMYALNVADGKLIWKFQTGEDREIYNQVGIASSAAVAGGTVYFGCRDGHFYAVDAKSGAEKWKHDNHKGWVIASPAVAADRVYFPTSDGTRFKALDARTGTLIFELVNRDTSYSSPAIAGNTAYFGTNDGWLHAVDLKAGKIRAEFQTDGNRENAAKYLDENGKPQMAALYPDITLEGVTIGLSRMFTLGSVLSSPVVAGGIVYFGSTDGHLYAVQ